MDDAIEGHDVPHDDTANDNCPWGLEGDQSQVQWVSVEGGGGEATARLTTEARELLSEPTPLMTSLRPEQERSKVPWLTLVLRKVALEACSSRSGPLSVCGQSQGHSPCLLAWASQREQAIPLASYHVVHKAFVDRDKECLVGELIVQEIQEGKTSRSGISIVQQHLGGWGDGAVGRLPPQLP